MDIFAYVFLNSSLLFFYFALSDAGYSITQNQSLSDGTTLVSKDGSFVLGFFSPGNTTNRYLGIWFNNIPVRTVVWVANRRNPITDLSGVLMANSEGSLVLLTKNRTVAWSVNSTNEARNPMVELLDSGNLVLRDENEENPENYLWQSFDYPSDTWLSGMKLGWDLRTGLERRLTAWKSPDDPSPGELSWGIELHNCPEIVMKKGSEIYFRTGPWNGIGFTGIPDLKENQIYNFNFITNKDEVYVIFHNIKKSVISRVVLNSTLNLYQRYVWVEAKKIWSLYLTLPKDICDSYNICGAYGNCIIGDSPVCQCVQGFQPKSLETWNPEEWSKGCVRSMQLSCEDKDKIGFVKLVGYKMPDTTYSWLNESMNLIECRDKCLNNCSCMAYTNSDIRNGGSGCAIWYGDLIDIRLISATGQNANGQDVYIRMPAEQEVKHKRKMKMIVILVVSMAIAVVFGILLRPYCICKRTHFRAEKMKNNEMIDQHIEGQSEDLELPFFSLATIIDATNNFSSNNKLGEGGFGPVYKGTLTNEKEVAIKRLSRSSGQGLSEFKNEVILISKLQHRNLVRLLGYCIEGEEKILIYEYMPNRSLDFFIFDQRRANVLGWSMRFNIICGIARGLLYLHEDSSLRIIHRDLKASNILLDSKMNPKISDFGMARIFGGDQTEGNTNRVVGTYGYMAPEYAIDGLFSVKSDVFSFGILLLEILSGKKNRGSFYQDHSLNLVGQAWKLWKENMPLKLIDTCLKDSCILSEIERCLHISFLCLQQHHEDRPNMSSVVMMLHSESPLPEPKELGFFVGKKSSVPSKNQSSSTNEVTITLLEAR
nr:G-type lectin S-receptor-like serine/threonine-protein kinase At4g27290 [Quercus suber]